MALAQRLSVKQSQSLVMTPQLQQAIKLLQCSRIELAAFVDLEIERNPLLELETDTERVDEHEASAPVDKRDNPDPQDGPIDMDAGAWGDDGPDYGPNMAAARTGAHDGARGAHSGRTRDIGETAAGHVSLRDHLFEQINIDIADVLTSRKLRRKIGRAPVIWLRNEVSRLRLS